MRFPFGFSTRQGTFPLSAALFGCAELIHLNLSRDFYLLIYYATCPYISIDICLTNYNYVVVLTSGRGLMVGIVPGAMALAVFMSPVRSLQRPVVRNLPVMEFSSGRVWHTPDAPPCCCDPKPEGVSVPVFNLRLRCRSRCRSRRGGRDVMIRREDAPFDIG